MRYIPMYDNFIFFHFVKHFMYSSISCIVAELNGLLVSCDHVIVFASSRYF